MKRGLIILTFTSALTALIITSTPFYNLAISFIISAFFLFFALFYVSKKQKFKTKTLQYVSILLLMAIGLVIYKTVFMEVSNTKANALQPTKVEIPKN